jgi:hypothetical protein
MRRSSNASTSTKKGELDVTDEKTPLVDELLEASRACTRARLDPHGSTTRSGKSRRQGSPRHAEASLRSQTGHSTLAGIFPVTVSSKAVMVVLTPMPRS